MSDKLFIEVGENISQSLAKANLYDEDYIPIDKSHAVGRTFDSVRVKSDYKRKDYEKFRPEDAFPTTRQEILRSGQKAYDKVGIVRNVIDLMADFGVKGIRVSHPIPSVQRFYEEWFRRVEGVERSERFLNCLYRLGTVVIYRNYSFIPKDEEKRMKAVADRRIPIKYTFLNPENIDLYIENLSSFTTSNIYRLVLPTSFYSTFGANQGKSQDEMIRVMTRGLAPEIRDGILKKKREIILDQSRLKVYNYKKDDWDGWGKPVTFPIMNDLISLEKLKLADISALDGAISNVRLWNIGRLTDSPATTILPTQKMLKKLRNILENNVGGGTLDLVWGPELSFKESSTQVHNFLGADKYKPTLDAIYDGLGIPIALRGDVTNASATNYMSLKTLIERLNYGRNLLLDFWNAEIRSVQKEMGFSKPAVIEFDTMVLTDEAAEKQLLINLADRDIVSHETICDKFGITPEIESAKVRRESKKRGVAMPEKASPYHNPEKLHEYQKILLNGGTITPSEIGIELQDKLPGQMSRMELLSSRRQENPAGRPPNIVETEKRRGRTGDDVRLSRAELIEFYTKASINVSNVVDKAVISARSVDSVEALTKQDQDSLLKLKAYTLFNLSPSSDLSAVSIIEAFNKKSILCKEDVDRVLASEMDMEEKSLALMMLYISLNQGNN